MPKGFSRSSKRRKDKYFGEDDVPSAKGPTSATRADEGRLVAAAQGGDAAALRRLLALVSRPALRFGMTFCRDREDAEEIAQDVLSSLVRSLPRYRGDAALSTWAYTVARRACMRRRRTTQADASAASRRGENGAEPADRDPASDPQGRLERREIREAVAAALRSLPATLREAVVLRDVEGLSAREAAKVLRVTERALKSRLHRARAALRITLQPLVTGREIEPTRRGCPDIARSWSLHLEGGVSAPACARLERHVRECPECAATCRTLRAALRECRALRAVRRPGGRKRATGAQATVPTTRAAKG